MMRCKICFSSAGRIHDAQPGDAYYPYYWCVSCRFVFKDPDFYVSPEKERQRYLQHINSPEDSAYVAMLTGFLEKSVLPYQQPGGRALDFGSGPGPVLAGLLEKAGYTTDTYDIYFQPETELRENTYGLVTCTEVVEHLAEPMETLAFIKSLLRPGGVLAIMTMFHQGEEHFKTWWYRRDATHISFFHPETFRYIAGELDLSPLMTDGKNTLSFRKK